MVRLVFRPYTQVRRSICTSELLRASTRVSSGFALLGHSSPSFGSQEASSNSRSTTVWPHDSARDAPAARGRLALAPDEHLRSRFAFTRVPGFAERRLPGGADGRRHPMTRTPLALLGPCFKTGLRGPTLHQRPGPQHMARAGRNSVHPTVATRTPPQPGAPRPHQTPTDRPALLPKRPTAPARGDATPRWTGRTGCTCLRGCQGDRNGNHLPATRWQPNASLLTVIPTSRVCREAGAAPTELDDRRFHLGTPSFPPNGFMLS